MPMDTLPGSPTSADPAHHPRRPPTATFTSSTRGFAIRVSWVLLLRLAPPQPQWMYPFVRGSFQCLGASRWHAAVVEDLDLSASHAVITGGSSGIGLATALELARRGAHVTLIARGAERLAEAEQLVLKAGAPVVRLASVDVADQAAVQGAIAAAATAMGPVDVLVTCAGIARPGRFTELDDEVFRSMMEVDYFGTLWPIRAVTPSMVTRRTGSIVGVSSAAGLVGIYGYTAYGAAKFAVRGLLEALRGELAPHGVHVGCAFPPDVDTPQLEDENRFKPAETRAISGSIKPLEASAVADSILAGIEHRRFEIVPDLSTRTLARTASLVPGAYRRWFDRRARSATRS